MYSKNHKVLSKKMLLFFGIFEYFKEKITIKTLCQKIMMQKTIVLKKFC